MSYSASEIDSKRFSLSVLDRLCSSPADLHSVDDLASCNWQVYLENLLRDINDLLNTRSTIRAQVLRDLPEVSRSVVAYGLPEVSRVSVGDERGITDIAMAMTEVLRRFEPRISRPRVTSSTPLEGGVILFRLEADVKAEPAPIRLVFDTTFNSDRFQYRVEGHLDEG